MAEPIVSVWMVAYNQEKYVGQALDSILTQKVNFPYEIIIGEDCSTDATRSIIEKYAADYPDIVKPVLHKQNVGAIRNAYEFCYPRLKGKYIACLEGDDFWTDPLKLQKQVDFLEHNPDYGLIHGDVNHLYEESGRLVQAHNKLHGITIPQGDIFAYLLGPAHMIKTMTVCFRREIADRYFDYRVAMEKKWRLTDLPLWLDILRHSKAHYMDEVLATYRLQEESASRSQSLDKNFGFYQSLFHVLDYYCAKYSCDAEKRSIINEYKFKSMLRFSLAYKDRDILKDQVKGIRKEGGHLKLRSAMIYALLNNGIGFSIASGLYHTLRKAK